MHASRLTSWLSTVYTTACTAIRPVDNTPDCTTMLRWWCNTPVTCLHARTAYVTDGAIPSRSCWNILLQTTNQKRRCITYALFPSHYKGAFRLARGADDISFIWRLTVNEDCYICWQWRLLHVCCGQLQHRPLSAQWRRSVFNALRMSSGTSEPTDANPAAAFVRTPFRRASATSVVRCVLVRIVTSSTMSQT